MFEFKEQAEWWCKGLFFRGVTRRVFFHKEWKTQFKVQQKDSKHIKDLFVLFVLLEWSKVGEVNVEKLYSESLVCIPGPSKIHSYKKTPSY